MTDSFTSVSRTIIVSAALVIVIAGMKSAASLLVPFLLAIFIAVISFPFMSMLQQKGLSKGLSLTLVISAVIVTVVGLGYLIGSSVNDFSQALPLYEESITAKWSGVIQWLNDHGISVAGSIEKMADPTAAVGLLSSIIKGFGGVLANSFMIILTVIFILMETAGRAPGVMDTDNAGTESLPSNGNDFFHVFVGKLRSYMGMKTLISILTGAIIAIAMWLIGVDYPVLWGVLAFMLNFVPNIGSIIAAVPAVMLSLIQQGVGSALLVAAVFVAVNMVVGNVIEPRYMGKGLGLSTLVVFVSLVFWGWVLGPVGMLLSVPLTITVKLALDSKPETRRLGQLLGAVESQPE